MSRRALIRPQAEADLREQRDYFAEHAPHIVAKFSAPVADAIDQLAAMPGMGPIRPCRNPRLAGLRKWRISGFRHIIFYRPIEEGIEVIRVLHGARNLDALLDE